MILFAVGAIVLGAMYFIGHLQTEQTMQQGKRTAAALSVGQFPFWSIPVLIFVLVTSLLVGRKPDGDKERA